MGLESDALIFLLELIFGAPDEAAARLLFDMIAV
jgi:hypothetical protein